MERVLAFIRHGNAEKGKVDIARPLNEKGRKQTQARRKKLGGTRFDLAITSPAVRCRQTAEILVEETNTPIVELQELYTAADVEIMWQVYERLVDAPLEAYLESEARELICAYGKSNAAKILAIIERYGKGIQNVLIAGHTPLSQSIGYAITKFPSLLSIRTDGAEGFQINLNTRGVVLIQG